MPHPMPPLKVSSDRRRLQQPPHNNYSTTPSSAPFAGLSHSLIVTGLYDIGTVVLLPYMAQQCAMCTADNHSRTTTTNGVIVVGLQPLLGGCCHSGKNRAGRGRNRRASGQGRGGREAVRACTMILSLFLSLTFLGPAPTNQHQFDETHWGSESPRRPPGLRLHQTGQGLFRIGLLTVKLSPSYFPPTLQKSMVH